MSLKPITDAKDLEGKRVLVRVDWNVPIVGGKVVDDYRIKQSLPTIEYLVSAGAKVIIATHLEPVETPLDALRQYLPAGAELLDNLRLNPGEKENSLAFAKELASKADIFVNEAFSTSHREHASIVGVPKFLPAYAGIRFMLEIQELSKAFYPRRPFLFILGGAKFDTKLPLIKKFINIADNIFVGGALAHNFFQESDVPIGASLVSSGFFNLKEEVMSDKLHLPQDMLVKRGEKMHILNIEELASEDIIVDAGPNTILALMELIKSSTSILWNGPLGKYEDGYKKYTLELAAALAETSLPAGKGGKEVIVGGADTMAAISELNIFDKFSFLSTGGGAMLDFLATGTLPGIEALSLPHP